MRSLNDITIKEVFGNIRQEAKIPEKIHEPKTKTHPEEAYVIIGKERNIPHKMAQCCMPREEDRIVGAIGK